MRNSTYDNSIYEFYLFAGIRCGNYYVKNKWIYLYYLAFCKEQGLKANPNQKSFTYKFNKNMSGYITSYRLGYNKINKVALLALVKWIKANYPNEPIPPLITGKKVKRPVRKFHDNEFYTARPLVDSLGRVYSSVWIAHKRTKVNLGQISKILKGKRFSSLNLKFYYLDPKYIPLIPKDFIDGDVFFKVNHPTEAIDLKS